MKYDDCDPLTRESTQKLRRIIELGMNLRTDAKSIDLPGDYGRLSVIWDHAHEILDLVDQIKDQVDLYGVRRRERISRPPAALPRTIVTATRVRQLRLLPGPNQENQSA